jgi:tRNA 2-thiouridine synthesizing protein A
MTPDPSEDDSVPLRELRRLVGGLCHGCGLRYNPQDVVFSVALGFKAAPRCLPCLAASFNRSQYEFRTDLLNYVQRRECYLRAWEEAERMITADTPTPLHTETGSPRTDGVPEPVAEWDAGDLGCGELVLALRIRLNGLPSGAVLSVRATDPAAPEDLPAWCGLTGHALVSANHPLYLIRRK